MQNVHIPGMLHGRRVRPRGAGANTVENDTPISVDPTSIAHIPNAQVVQIANFIGVVAPKEYDAIQAAAQLKVTWQTSNGFPQGSGNYWSWLRQAGDTNTTNPPRFTTNNGNVAAGLAGAAQTVSATYGYHYNSFMPIGPHCAVADVNTNGGIVYVQAQALTGLPLSMAQIIGAVTGTTPPTQNVRVVWYEGASSFGGGQTIEVNEEAVALSAKLGKPVRVQWMRWDQHGWDHYGMGNLWDVKMGSDANGNIVAADWQTYGQAQSNIDEHRRLLNMVTWPAVPGAGGIAPPDSAIYGNSAVPTSYLNTARRVLAKTQPLYGGALKCNFLRAPSAPQMYFAGEQIIDELAHAMNMDPIAFRRKNIDPTTVGRRSLAGSPRCVHPGRRLAAEGGELDQADRQHSYRSRLRVRHVRIEPGRHRGGRPGEHEVRRACGAAPVHRAEQRRHDRPAARREPDERLGDHGPLPRDVGAAAVEHAACHEPRLGHLPDPPLLGVAEGDAGQRSSWPVHDGQPGLHDGWPECRRQRWQHERVRRRLEPLRFR